MHVAAKGAGSKELLWDKAPRPTSIGIAFLLALQMLVLFSQMLNLNREREHEPIDHFVYRPKHKPIKIRLSRLYEYNDEALLSRNRKRHATMHDNASLLSTDALNRTKSARRLKTEHVGKQCAPASEWQTRAHSHSTCNVFHELDFLMANEVKPLGMGAQRIVWQVRGMDVVVKTLRADRSFSTESYKMHRIDALVAERLTSSPNIVDIYGYCGQSVVNELGHAGLDREHVIKPLLSSSEHNMVRYAYDLAAGVRDMHAVGVVHRDIDVSFDRSKSIPLVSFALLFSPSNVPMHFLFVKIANVIVDKRSGMMKLNDFNGAWIMGKSNNGTSCGFKDDVLCGQDGRRADTKSPEECRGSVLNEKLDVYSVGSIIFRLLTGKRMYHSDLQQAMLADDAEKMRDAIASGSMRPKLPTGVEQSTERDIVLLKTAMWQALTAEAEERPSAQELAKYIRSASLHFTRNVTQDVSI